MEGACPREKPFALFCRPTSRARWSRTCADGVTNQAIAERAGVGREAVGIWRRRFVDKRLERLYDGPCVRRPREIGDEHVEGVVIATLESKPRVRLSGSTRNMAKEDGALRNPR